MCSVGFVRQPITFCAIFDCPNLTEAALSITIKAANIIWSGDHVAIRQLVEHFARYLYLPRLSDPQVRLRAISDGLGLMLWQQDSFAYADSFDCRQLR